MAHQSLFEPTEAADPVSINVRRSLPGLYAVLVGRSDAMPTPYTGHAKDHLPRLSETLIAVRAALLPTLDPALVTVKRDIEPLLDGLMHGIDKKLCVLLANEGWKRKKDDKAFEPWAALVLHAYTTDQDKKYQRVALHAEINQLLLTAWGPDRASNPAAATAAATRLSQGAVGVRLGDYIKLLFEAANAALVPADAVFPSSKPQVLHRHIRADLGSWPMGTARRWPMFTSTSCKKDTAVKFRDAVRSDASLGGRSTLCALFNIGRDGRRALNQLSYISTVSAFENEGEVLFVPGLEVECTQSHEWDPAPSRSDLVERDLDLRIVASKSLLDALKAVLSGGQTPSGGAPPPTGGASGSTPSSGSDNGGGGGPGATEPPSSAGGDAAGSAAAASTAAQTHQMARVARDAGFAEAMLAYFHAAIFGSPDEDGGGGEAAVATATASPAAAVVRRGGAPAGASDAAAMARVAADAGFADAMAAYHDAALHGSDRGTPASPPLAAAGSSSASGSPLSESEGSARRRRRQDIGVAIAPGGIPVVGDDAAASRRAAARSAGAYVAPAVEHLPAHRRRRHNPIGDEAGQVPSTTTGSEPAEHAKPKQ